MGGPWRTRKDDDRPHGLDIVEALAGPDGWGTERTSGGTRVVWATLEWSGRVEMRRHKGHLGNGSSDGREHDAPLSRQDLRRA